MVEGQVEVPDRPGLVRFQELLEADGAIGKRRGRPGIGVAAYDHDPSHGG